MWHEARKHEKKLRVLIVDYRRRAERRREFYEKFKADPTQFMQVHGRPCKIHMDSQITAAAENCMMPWQGNADNMIDRFDARAHLDRIPDAGAHSAVEGDNNGDTGKALSTGNKEEDAGLNYERYRILIQNDLAGTSEDKFLHQIYIEEQFGTPTPIFGHHMKGGIDASKPKTAKAAIGYNYEESTPAAAPAPSSASRSQTSLISPTQDEAEEESDEDVDFDLLVNVKDLNLAQQAELNNGGVKYGLAAGDFMRYLNGDLEEKEKMRLAKLQEEEKQTMSGRKARRERRAYKDRIIMRKGYISPPSYARANSPGSEEKRRSESRSESRSKSRSASPEKITYITSFGGNESDDEKKRGLKSGLVFGPVLPPDGLPLAKKWNRNLSLSRSPVRRRIVRSRSRSRSLARRNKLAEYSISIGGHRRRRSNSSSDQSNSKAKSSRSLSSYGNSSRRRSRSRSNNNRLRRSRTRSRSRNRLRSRDRHRSVSRSRSDKDQRSRRRTRSISKSRSRSPGRDRHRGDRRSSSRSRHSMVRKKSRSPLRSRRKSNSSTRGRSNTPSRSPRKRHKSRSSSSSSKSSASPPSLRIKKAKAISPHERKSNDTLPTASSLGIDSLENVKLPSPPVKRYYSQARARVGDDEEKSNDSLLSSDSSSDSDRDTKSRKSLSHHSVPSGKSSVSTSSKGNMSTSGTGAGSSGVKLTPQERLKRRMQLALNRQLKADKEAEKSRTEKRVQERLEREESLREISIKYRRREREKRHRNLHNTSDSSRSGESSKSNSRSNSPSRSRSQSPCYEF